MIAASVAALFSLAGGVTTPLGKHLNNEKFGIPRGMDMQIVHPSPRD